MGPSKCGVCSRTKHTKNMFAPGATARFLREWATLCAYRAMRPTCAATGTRAVGSGAAKRLQAALKLQHTVLLSSLRHVVTRGDT